MSLNGSLADLGLADVMQILSMSGRSGVLILQSSEGEGRIMFRDGLVRGAVLENGPQDLQGILVGGNLVRQSEFDVAEADARSSGVDVEAMLTERGLIDREILQSVCRESVESAVIQLLQWKSGKFTWDVREASEPGDPLPFAPGGISPQYLAIEACRLADEGGADENEGESCEGDDGSVEKAFEAAPVSAARPMTAPAQDRRRLPAVVIDSDLLALEWTKQSLADLFPRIHVFQRSEHALARIRHYLARSEMPFVILSAGALADPSALVPNSAAFADRLKALVPRLPIFWLEVGEAASLAATTPNEGLARRPTKQQLGSENAGSLCARLAGELHTAIEERLASGSASSGDGPAPGQLT